MSLIDRYVTDLFNYAAYTEAYANEDQLEGRPEIDTHRLKSFFNYATVVLRGGDIDNLPDELYSFLNILSPEDSEAVLIKFIDKAREALGFLGVEIFSAVRLSVAQRTRIEKRLEDIFGKEVSMRFRVDPSLIGGLRVLAGDAVLDNTIKTRLADMKKNVYKEVYLKE